MADTETINEIPNLNPTSLPVQESELKLAAVSEIPVLALSSYCSHHTNTVYICQYDKYLIIIFQGNRGGHVDGGGSNKWEAKSSAGAGGPTTLQIWAWVIYRGPNNTS